MVSGTRTGQPIFRSVLRTANAFYSYSERTAPLCVLTFPAWIAQHARPSARVAERQTRWLQVPVSARTWGFKSPLAHQATPGLTWGYMESAAGPESPGWHQGGTDSVRRPWHGMD